MSQAPVMLQLIQIIPVSAHESCGPVSESRSGLQQRTVLQHIICHQDASLRQKPQNFREEVQVLPWPHP